MKKFEKLTREFNEFLANESFKRQPKELYDPIDYTLKLGGKRIRPVMALLATDCFGGDYKDTLNAALGIEIFHNFTLLHDDIMDDAPIRRGQPTVYQKWNSNIAILSGDTMFALAYEYITNSSPDALQKILRVFNKTAIEVCEGQQYDMNYETSEICIDEYMRMIKLKTAVFLGACLKIGALIAGAEDKDVENIYHFGENLGIAFQLQDDLLDVFGNEDKFGKKTGGDIVTNKKTYLYLKAFELAKGDDLKTLEENFIQNHPNNEKKVEIIKSIYIKLNVADYTHIEIGRYYNLALQYLGKISLNDDNSNDIKQLAERLIKRDY
ncbi:MAG: isoprenyl synthetase [Bacteroidetes bacterium]|nr:isoprenyl synthetase [Bacteroidota bacterium]